MSACFPLLSAVYFENLLLSIGAAQTQEELQALVDDVYGEISILESTITSQLALLAPIEALLVAPGANLTDIVDWITGMIGVLTNMYRPFLTMTAQLTAIAGEVATLTAAVDAAAALRGFTIAIPPISIVCELA